MTGDSLMVYQIKGSEPFSTSQPPIIQSDLTLFSYLELHIYLSSIIGFLWGVKKSFLGNKIESFVIFSMRENMFCRKPLNMSVFFNEM